MKNFSYLNLSSFQFKWYLSAIMFFGLLTFSLGQAGEEVKPEEGQSDTTKTEEEETNEKLALRLSFDAYKINDDVKLVAKTRLKVKGKFQNISNVEVSFYKGDSGAGILLGKDTTDHNGEAYWIIPSAQVWDSAGSVMFLVLIQNHPDYEDAEESVSVPPSVLEMKLEEEDSVKMVKLFVGYPDETGQIMPVTAAECRIYVKRLFGLLPIGEAETTDEEGQIEVEFPQDVKGDESGNITVIAKIEEHEIIGNVEASRDIPWGIPSKTDDFYLRRELWSARANSPIALIIIVNAALIGIWGMIVFIFLEIIKINKLGKTTGSKHT